MTGVDLEGMGGAVWFSVKRTLYALGWDSNLTYY